MIWFVDTRRFLRPRPDQIGPGRLVLVVGPSGAGKDTLIAGARAACADNPTVIFPRRVVTRHSTTDEEHDSISEETFRHAVASDTFSLWWEAHGHCYGLPRSLDAEIRNGRTVVCNVSRTILGFARRRYAAVTVVLVTAPLHVLTERLAGRGRTSDGQIQDRIAIRNVGRPETGIRRLLNVVSESGFVLIS
jgi:ribose 1,5-bisphosphokinase